MLGRQTRDPAGVLMTLPSKKKAAGLSELFAMGPVQFS